MENRPENKKKSLLERIRTSVIISFLMSLATLIYQKLECGFYGGIATSYDSENRAAQNSMILSFAKKAKWGERAARPAKHAIARAFEQSAILGRISRCIDTLLYCSQKVHGVFFVSFGLYVEIVFLIKAALGDGFKNADYTTVLVGAVFMIMSLPMIFSTQSLAEAVRESRLMSFIVFDIIGAKRESFTKDIAAEDHMYTPFIAGMVLGLLSAFVSPLLIALAMLGALCAFAVLMIPEFGVLAIAVLSPFAPTMVLAALTVYVAFCFLLKLLCGKRSLGYSLNDLMITVFAVLTLLGGFISPDPAGSIRPALIYTVFLLAYYLCANLIRTKEWLNKCLYGMMASLFVVSAYGVIQYVFGFGASTWHDEEMFSDISGRVVSTFENPNVLAEYLIMLIPLSFALMISSTKRDLKAASLVSLASSVLCLVFTWSRGAWLGFIFGMLVFLLMYSKKILAAMFASLALLPFLPFVLPESIINRFSSIGNIADSSTSYRVNIWSGVVKMLRDHWFTGIGTGLPAFSQVYPKYSLSGIETAPHAHNLFLQIVTEHGVVAFAVFIIIILLYVQSVFTFNRFETRKTKLATCALMCGILAVLVQGMTDYIWYNYRVYLIFWIVVGLTTASRRCHRATRT